MTGAVFVWNIQAQTIAVSQTNEKTPVDALIPWLLQENAQVRGIPFREVIFDVTDKRVLAFNPKNETDLRVVKQISVVLDGVISQLNSPASVIQGIPRINEVSSHFEDLMRELLNKTPRAHLRFSENKRRSSPTFGLPRLEVDRSRIASRLLPRSETLRSREPRQLVSHFYFEPKIATNKVREDAVHFIVGFEHEKPAADRHWKFTRWDLVDLSHFQVKLKAEFQGSNRDMYRPEAIVATSAK